MDSAVTILVIDDDAITSDILEALLKEDGFRTLAAREGREGRAAARQNSPDLILLDLNLPDEDGYTTCSMLKRDPATADIPVIFLSSDEHVSAKVTGLGMGAVDYITKPFNREEILARVNAQVRLRRAYESRVAALDSNPKDRLPGSDSNTPGKQGPRPVGKSGSVRAACSALWKKAFSGGHRSTGN